MHLINIKYTDMKYNTFDNRLGLARSGFPAKPIRLFFKEVQIIMVLAIMMLLAGYTEQMSARNIQISVIEGEFQPGKACRDLPLMLSGN